MKNIEVELKFQILDIPQIEKFLRNFQFINEKRILDIYLDTQKKDLYKKGVFIRMRDNKKLDFKFNLADFQNQNEISKHEYCNEHSFELPLTDNSVISINKICRILNLKGIKTPIIEELTVRNNLTNSVVIDKIRRKFTDGKFEFSFDDVKGLGKFVEIEFLASKRDNIDRIKKEMEERMFNLKLKLITTGYNEVYWRGRDFNLYLQGRYLFEEDYQKYRSKGR